MSTRVETATVYTCDGCGAEYVSFEGDEMPKGYHGSVWEIGGGGGSGSADWFADKTRCIGPAVKAAVERAWG